MRITAGAEHLGARLRWSHWRDAELSFISGGTFKAELEVHPIEEFAFGRIGDDVIRVTQPGKAQPSRPGLRPEGRQPVPLGQRDF